MKPATPASVLDPLVRANALAQVERINTEVHRQRTKNVEADDRMTVTIMQDGNWFTWAEVRGRVTEMVTGPEAREHIDKLALKYTGAPYANPIQSERVILKLTPEREVVFPPA